jgi:hypothetical protein
LSVIKTLTFLDKLATGHRRYLVRWKIGHFKPSRFPVGQIDKAYDFCDMFSLRRETPHRDTGRQKMQTDAFHILSRLMIGAYSF